MTTATWAAAAAPATPLPAADAACLSDAEVAAMFAAYEARTPAVYPEGLNAADGECTRAKRDRLLEARLGKPVGYKAGLTNPALQKPCNHDAPVSGALYAPMLLPAGAGVEAAFGARPLLRDMVVVVEGDGAELDRGKGSDVLEHPPGAVVGPAPRRSA